MVYSLPRSLFGTRQNSGIVLLPLPSADPPLNETIFFFFPTYTFLYVNNQYKKISPLSLTISLNTHTHGPIHILYIYGKRNTHTHTDSELYNIIYIASAQRLSIFSFQSCFVLFSLHILCASES